MAAMASFLNQSRNNWDPEFQFMNDISPSAAIRIKNDLNTIYKDPVPGISVTPDNNNFALIHALITGLFETPYEGGFFYFMLGIPHDYPLKPPKVKLKTTGCGTVRFNPNFYKNGKVCLSILGTWTGPEWTPAQNISSVLLSIQSLFNENPYFNEPGYTKEKTPGVSAHYNKIIKHETIRAAVCQILENRTVILPDFLAIVESSFSDYFEYYMDVCNEYQYLDGHLMNDPFNERRTEFRFGELKARLIQIKSNLDKKYPKGIDKKEEIPGSLGLPPPPDRSNETNIEEISKETSSALALPPPPDGSNELGIEEIPKGISSALALPPPPDISNELGIEEIPKGISSALALDPPPNTSNELGIEEIPKGISTAQAFDLLPDIINEQDVEELTENIPTALALAPPTDISIEPGTEDDAEEISTDLALGIPDYMSNEQDVIEIAEKIPTALALAPPPDISNERDIEEVSEASKTSNATEPKTKLHPIEKLVIKDKTGKPDESDEDIPYLVPEEGDLK